MERKDREQARAGTRGSAEAASRGRPGPVPQPEGEDEYWRSNWRTRPYTDRTRDYEHYRPAYRFGWESRRRYPDRRWEEVEAHLATEWQRHREQSPLKWDEARLAARDAWRRLEQHTTGGRGRDDR